jgi:hypothetical protein
MAAALQRFAFCRSRHSTPTGPPKRSHKRAGHQRPLRGRATAVRPAQAAARRSGPPSSRRMPGALDTVSTCQGRTTPMIALVLRPPRASRLPWRRRDCQSRRLRGRLMTRLRGSASVVARLATSGSVAPIGEAPAFRARATLVHGTRYCSVRSKAGLLVGLVLGEDCWWWLRAPALGASGNMLAARH